MSFEVFDALVIGSGQGGTPLAGELAGRGLKTALIERAYVGGTCINVGCTPTKTILASAGAASAVHSADRFGVHTDGFSLDMKSVRQRKREMVNSFRGGSEKRLAATKNLELIYGEASFVGERKLRIRLNSGGERSVSAKQVFINTGGRPAVPHFTGIEQVPYLDSSTIMELDTVPEHLGIIGAGYIAMEFAQGFRRFGSRVTILSRSSRILKQEDPEISEAMADILTEDGIDIVYSAQVSGLVRHGEQILIQGPDITVSHLLIAAGRAPNTKALNPGAGGVELDTRGFIRVNEYLETGAPGVWALGDVTGGPAFTHVSYDDYRILRDNLFYGMRRSTGERILAYTVFTDPQLGRVGMSEAKARTSGKNIRIASMPMAWVARALENDESRGMMKVIVDAESSQILGAAVLGMQGGEIMSILHTAMLGGIPYQVLKEAPYAHPTLAESLNNLFLNWKDET